jgi:hypothetical protein
MFVGEGPPADPANTRQTRVARNLVLSMVMNTRSNTAVAPQPAFQSIPVSSLVSASMRGQLTFRLAVAHLETKS